MGQNAVARMLGLLGDEWTLLLVQQAALGAARYGEFAARLPISHAVLTQRLASLTSEGLLHKRTYQDRPPRAEYVLTPMGRGLWPVLVSIWQWERAWVPDHALPAMRHTGCGADFAPIVTCRSCAAEASAKDVLAGWGPSGGWARSMPVEVTRRRASGSRAGLFPETMTILGNRWAFAILVSAFVGANRFRHFADQLGAPPGTLTDRLQILTANGVLDLTHGRYQLTEKGRATFGILVTALHWAQHWFRDEDGPAALLTHTACGGEFDAVLACDQCTGVLRGSEISAVDRQ